MARIEARLGKNKVKSFAQRHSHIPEKTFSLDEFKTKRKQVINGRKVNLSDQYFYIHRISLMLLCIEMTI